MSKTTSAAKLVLSVPHAIPPDTPPPGMPHLHDSLAPVMAACIHQVAATLRDNRVEVVRPFLPVHTSRDECDLNRRNCDDARESARAHPFRRRLRNFVTQYKSDILVVLDLHSYPSLHPFWSDYTVVVLDDDEDASGTPAWYVRDFVAFMNDNGVPATTRRGQHNDITNEMRVDVGVRAMLIEFNESLMPGSRADRFREQVCRLVLAWSNRLYKMTDLRATLKTSVPSPLP